MGIDGAWSCENINCFNILCVCEMYLHTTACKCGHVEVREQLLIVSSFILPCESRGSNSGGQTWWQLPLPTEPSLWFPVFIFRSLIYIPGEGLLFLIVQNFFQMTLPVNFNTCLPFISTKDVQ